MAFEPILAPFDFADALCAQTDPDLFFPEFGEETKARDAKKICRDCPVIAECLAYALDNPSFEGVWGGTSVRERREIRRRKGMLRTYVKKN